MNWRHSGFSVHNKARIARDDEKGRVALAQYIIRNTFSLEKLTYNRETGTVIYRSKIEFFDDLSAFNEHADGWPGYDESCIA